MVFSFWKQLTEWGDSGGDGRLVWCRSEGIFLLRWLTKSSHSALFQYQQNFELFSLDYSTGSTGRFLLRWLSITVVTLCFISVSAEFWAFFPRLLSICGADYPQFACTELRQNDNWITAEWQLTHSRMKTDLRQNDNWITSE
jgi:hypothetical protein